MKIHSPISRDRSTIHACCSTFLEISNYAFETKTRLLFKISKRGRSKPQSIIKTWHKYPIITHFIKLYKEQRNSPIGRALSSLREILLSIRSLRDLEEVEESSSSCWSNNFFPRLWREIRNIGWRITRKHSVKTQHWRGRETDEKVS